MLPLCEAERIAVIPWSPLARGLLAGTRKGIEDRAATKRAESDDFAIELYDQPGDWDVVDANLQVARARGVEPAEVALAWLLSKPAVTAPIVGATKLSHLEAAIRAVDLALTPEEVKALEAAYKPHPIRGYS